MFARAGDGSVDHRPPAFSRDSPQFLGRQIDVGGFEKAGEDRSGSVVTGVDGDGLAAVVSFKVDDAADAFQALNVRKLRELNLPGQYFGGRSGGDVFHLSVHADED